MKIRDAENSDTAELARIKKPEAIHRDRIRDAAEGEFRYLVCVDDSGRICGHACLVFRRPRAWPPDPGNSPYPRVIDVMIAGERRRQGLGTAFMMGLEAICRQAGLDQIHLSVDPDRNTTALRFYQTLGYTAAPGEPQWRTWSFKDSEGNVHEGEGLDLRMSKMIAEPQNGGYSPPAARSDQSTP